MKKVSLPQLQVLLEKHVDMLEKLPLDNCNDSQIRKELLDGIKTGKYRAFGNEEMILVCFIDRLYGEVYGVGAYGKCNIMDGTELVLGILEDIAKAENLDYVRFTTQRAGLIEKSIKLGYNISEVVMRKKINKETTI